MLKQIREIKFYLKPLRVYYLIIIQVDVNTIVSPLITSPLFHTTSINCICNLLLHADLINFSLFCRLLFSGGGGGGSGEGEIMDRCCPLAAHCSQVTKNLIKLFIYMV